MEILLLLYGFPFLTSLILFISLLPGPGLKLITVFSPHLFFKYRQKFLASIDKSDNTQTLEDRPKENDDEQEALIVHCKYQQGNKNKVEQTSWFLCLGEILQGRVKARSHCLDILLVSLDMFDGKTETHTLKQ